MLREIDGFHRDPVGDWVAELHCGHGQHVRHQPPFLSRPWVVTDEGRASQLGVELECPLCDRFELPAGSPRTSDGGIHCDDDAGGLPPITRRSPACGERSTSSRGSVRYIVEPPLARELVLDPDHPGIVVPEVRHRVAPAADARFFVEFSRRAAP